MSTPASTGSPTRHRTPVSKTTSMEENIKVGKEDSSQGNVSNILTSLLRFQLVSTLITCFPLYQHDLWPEIGGLTIHNTMAWSHMTSTRIIRIYHSGLAADSYGLTLIIRCSQDPDDHPPLKKPASGLSASSLVNQSHPQVNLSSPVHIQKANRSRT